MKIISLALAAVLASGLQRQTFKTAVDLVAVELNVVDKNGKPIGDLKPEDFEVWISQRPRLVVTIDRRSYGSTAPALPGAPISRADRAETAPSARRMFVLAVDEHSLQAGSAMAAVNAAHGFIDKLQPDALVGVYAFPTGKATHDLCSWGVRPRRPTSTCSRCTWIGASRRR